MKKTLCVVLLLLTGCEAGDAGYAVHQGRPVDTWMQWLRGEDISLKQEAMAALDTMGPENSDAVNELIPGLKDQDPVVRLQCVRSLGRIGPGAKAALPTMRQLVSDPHPVVRKTALRTLHKLERTK